MSVNFTWIPNSVPLSYTVGGHTYPYSTQADAIARPSDSRYAAFTTPANTNLTFTATVVLPPGIIATEYRWDFGDGTIGYGPSVVHSYKVAASDIAVNLVVTDSHLNRTSRSRILNLRPATQILITQGLALTA